MSRAIGDHLRSNVVGYIAIFLFASGGTAFALAGTNTVFTDDIVNGEVRTADIQEDAINGNKIHDDSTASRHVVDNTLQSEDVLDGTLTGADVSSNSIDGTDITNETLTTNDLQSDSVQFDEIENETIGAADIGPSAIGASEVGDAVITRAGTAVNVPGGTAENGAYDVSNATAACNAGEELIGGNGQWVPDDNSSGNHELWIAEVRYNAGAESVSVDGGNDSGADHSIQAVALCLTV